MPFLKSFLTLIFFTITLVQLGYSQKKESLLSKKYNSLELKQDAVVLRDVLLAMHPAIGLYQSRELYERQFNDFITSLKDSLTEKQFRIKMKLLIDNLHCGHTEVLYSRAFYKEMNKLKLNFSPYVFIPVQNKVYLITTLNKKQDSVVKKGSEIIKINDVAVDSMLRYSKRFISSDGFNQTAKNHYIQYSFNSYFLGLFGRPDTFNIEYKEGKVLKTITYPAFKTKSFPPLPLGPKDDSLYIYYKRAKIKHRFLDSANKTMIVKIERFTHKKYNKSYRKIFRKLQKNKSENLIIDLRNNGGGSLANSYRLLSYLIDSTSNQTLKTGIKNYPYKKYTRGNISFRFTRFAYKVIGKKVVLNDTDNFVYTIKPRKKNHYNKKIYVLINGGSFSASCLVAAYLKTNNRAVFIGEETGGTREGCNAGITPYYKLPNTKLRVRVPAFRIQHDVCPQLTGHGIMPDYRIEYTLKDILYKRDLELQKVKELLQLKIK